MSPMANQGKRRTGPKGRTTPSGTMGIRKRPQGSPRKGSVKSSGGEAGRTKKSRRVVLPLLSLWLLAIVILVGLIYWGQDVKRPATAVKNEVRSSTRHVEERTSQRNPAREDILPKPPKVQSADESASQPRPPRASHSQEPSLPVAVQDLKETPPPFAPPQPPLPPEPPVPKESPPKPTQIEHIERSAPLAVSTPAHRPSITQEDSIKPPPPPPEPSLSTPMAKAAIIIDDFGMDLDAARKFLSLPIPITFSVLPYQRHSREIADLAHAHNREVILHTPMEPRGYPKVNPGAGALLVSMSAGDLQRTLRRAIDSSPHIVGVNNHMGSKLTENPDVMKLVLAELRQHNLYFVDSYTSNRSIVSSLAREIQVPCLRRDIFLDHDSSEDAVRSQLLQFIRRAKVQGTAVAIGHPHEITFRVLSREAERFNKEGIAIVPVKEIILNNSSLTHGR